ncbi:MAG: DNA internalization-related competence protein ComEC/Rec2 [Deltaproteobacteria bacterium]|nr:DNA internalization-related competence protein ComEC/Rec2 [Deltaproteobacteria bacterium]
MKPWKTIPLLPPAILLVIGILIADNLPFEFFRFNQATNPFLSTLIQRGEKEIFLGTLLESHAAPDRTTFDVRLIQVNDKKEGWLPLSGKIRLSLPEPPESVPGDGLLFRCRLKEPHSFQNEGSFDTARFLQRKGIQATGFIASPLEIQKIESPRTSFMGTIEKIRNQLKKKLSGPEKKPEEGFLRALLIDDRSGLTPPMTETLQTLGLSHLLSISGLHISMVTTSFFALLLFLFKRSYRLTLLFPVKKIAAAASFIPLLFYLLLSGSPPAALRAAVMVSLYLTALIFDKEKDLWNVLAAAALLLLAWEPTLLFERSFQLSFLAVIGITFVLTEERFKNRNVIIRTLLISTSTLLLTAPVAAAFASQFTLAGLFCNFWAIPFVGFLILPLTFAGAITTFIFSPLGDLFFQAALFLSHLFLTTLSLILPYFEKVAIPVSFTNPEIILFLLSLFLLGLVIHFRKCWWWVLLSFLLFSGLFLYPFFSPLWSSSLRVHFLDVGEGDAALVEFPKGVKWLVDSGGFLIPPKSGEKQPFDIGQNVLVPYFLKKRIYYLDRIILTHPHPDHYGGMLSVIRKISVGEIWMTEATFPDQTFINLMNEIRKQGIPIHFVSSKETVFTVNGVRGEILYPDFYNPQWNLNDNSIVLKLTFGEISFLLTGDIEREGEKRMSQLGPQIRSTILKVPHHGSNTSSSTPFLEAVQPALAVMSVGWKNPFHFPRPEVLERYEREKIKLLRTDQNGEVTVVTDGERFEIKTVQ